MPSQIASSFDPIEGSDGPLETEGYVCPSKGAPFILQKVILPSLAPTMVQVDIIMTGLCHTDIHMRDNDWVNANYPLLAGHEAVATVSRVGAGVRSLKEGDRVAVSWIRDSCASCKACLSGRENLCETGYQGTYLGLAAGPWGRNKLEYNKHGGCFARVQRIEEKFAVKIPDDLPNEIACPLVCGGATVYEPLCDYGGPGKNVGIIGIGGLGTAAIKLGRLMGCVMHAISRSDKKRQAVLRSGASKFICSSNQEEVDAAKGTLDVIIDTTPVNLELSPLLSYLKIGGVYCRVGLMGINDMKFSGDFVPFVIQCHTVTGSAVTGSVRMREMLDLVAANLDFMKDIEEWKTEKVPISEVNNAMEKLSKGTNKGYRYVLTW